MSRPYVRNDAERICAGGSFVRHRLISSPNAEQLGFSHIDGSPGASGGSALTPHAVQIGETSPSSVSSHRSLMASVSLPLRRFVHSSKTLNPRSSRLRPPSEARPLGVGSAFVQVSHLHTVDCVGHGRPAPCSCGENESACGVPEIRSWVLTWCFAGQ